MKRWLSLVLVLCLCLSLAACGGDQQAQTTDPAGETSQEIGTTPQTEAKPGTIAPHADFDPTFNIEATISETVVYDKDGLKITAKGLTYDDIRVFLNLEFTNSGDQALHIQNPGECGSNLSVNGYMIDPADRNSDMSVDLAPGETVNADMILAQFWLLGQGIQEIADMEIGFEIRDEDGESVFTGPLQLKTNLFEKHDYEMDVYAWFLSDTKAMEYFDTQLESSLQEFPQELQYDHNGVVLQSAYWLRVGTNHAQELYLEFQNDGQETVKLDVEALSLNGLRVDHDEIANDLLLNPGRRGVITVIPAMSLREPTMEAFGIGSVDSVHLVLQQEDQYGEELTEEIGLTAVRSDSDSPIDESGEVIYDGDGVKLTHKGAYLEENDYLKNCHVLLLARNDSDKPLYFYIGGDAVSLNAEAAVDALCGKVKVEPGESYLMDIMLRDNALRLAHVDSLDEVTLISFQMGLEGVDGETVHLPVFINRS